MKKNDEVIVDIIALSSEGKGISKVDEGFVIFTTGALPGDSAKIKISKKKSNYAEANILELINPSQFRITPKCSHFGVCGGCKLQNYSYEKQLEYKTDTVKNAFERIGGFENLNIPNSIPCADIFFYRNKMEYSFTNDVWHYDINIKDENFGLGLHVPNFHSKIINIKECFLQSDLSVRVLNFSRDYFKNKGTSIYSTKTHSGFLRFLIIRQCRNTKDIMLNIVTNEFDKELMEEYSGEFKNKFPEITTFVNSTSQKKAQVAFGEDSKIFYGDGFIFENLKNKEREYQFKISPNSFFQTNTKQAEMLYSIAENFLELKKSDNILDLYCGAGSISIYISEKVNKVTGVELIDDAISNAKENVNLNNVTNVNFVLSDIKNYLETFFKEEQYSNYNKIILDPPRSGLHPDICNLLSESNFERICYISCNPVTQARDLKIICEKNKYEIEKIQPVDMFPQTYHIENVVLLKKKTT